MNRIDALFKTLAARHQKAFVAYLVAGDPDLAHTVRLVHSLERAGVDLIELGIPFSDPLADGLVNQLGAQRALAAGTTVSGILSTVEQIRATSNIPLVLFTYYNPIFHLGLDEFTRRATASGVDGALILDLPPEAAAREWPASDLKRITLIAPTTPVERIRQIAPAASGFIYYISRAGVTGMRDQLPADLAPHIAQIRAATPLPVCVGFGVTTPAHAAAVARLADGVIVGSAIVNRIAQLGPAPDLGEQLRAFVAPLVQATHQR